MLTPLILFFGLTVATAVIAHWSDNLGKKLGKKRVSLMGLRPRTTATVLTIASSWCIMIFTLAAMLLAVPPLSRALFSYDAERAQAAADREQAALDSERANAQIETGRERIKATQREFDRANGQLAQAEERLKRANQAVRHSRQAAQDAVKQGDQRAAQARKQAANAVKAADVARRDVTKEQSLVALAETRLIVARGGENAARQQARLVQIASAKVAHDLEASRGTLRTVQKQVQVAQSNLKTTRSNLIQSQKKLLESYREHLKTYRQVSGLRTQRDALQSQTVALQNLATQTLSLASETLSNDAPVRVGQVFAARVIEANRKPEVIFAQLQELLKQGQQSFAEDEDISPRFSSNATMQLLPLPVMVGKKAVVLAGDQILHRWARDIAESQQTTAMRLVSPRNFLADETRIEVVFVAVPIKPAFDSGQILASATIDGAQDDARIFHSLIELTNLGRQTAEKQGVNPPQSPDEPNFYDKGTIVHLFDALRRIENSKSRLTVNLIADRALTTVEPLQVRFEIEGIQGQPTS